jgi:hypothetical protein
MGVQLSYFTLECPGAVNSFSDKRNMGIPWGEYKEMHHYIIPHPAFDWPSVNVEHYLSLSDSVELRLVLNIWPA